MKISIISNYTFASSLPDDLKSIHQYGSESMSAILSQQLSKTHEVHFYAPIGSSRVGQYHPLKRTDGKYLQSDLLQDITLDGRQYTDLLDSFVIDMTPWSNNVQELFTYNNFRNYLCYRLGYKDYEYPKINPQYRNYITHCQNFADLYKKAGFDCAVAHFGISDFWNPSQSDMMPYPCVDYFAQQFALDINYPYYLYPHRYNKEKGSLEVIRLAKDFPDKTFVLSSAAVLPDHVAALQELRQIAPKNCTFVQFPSTPDREFYRRELYRNAIATLSPFHNNIGYYDTGGILSMESLKCGTPVIVTRSDASEEILGHQEDHGAFFIDGYESLKLHVKYTDFLSAKPAPWKWTIERYVNEYKTAIDSIIT